RRQCSPADPPRRQDLRHHLALLGSSPFPEGAGAALSQQRRRRMRIAVLGGGPAGLYFAALWKRRHPADAVRLWEQNAADATWGFGVVFSDRALEFLGGEDADTLALIAPRLQHWHDIVIVHRGQRITIDGVGFAAIGRLALLQLLQQQAAAAGVEMAFGRAVTSLASL